jgi:ABC-2 type transport system permease protein
VITNRFDLPAFGDVIFGVILLTIFAVKMQLSWFALGLLVGCILPAALITLAVNLCCGCIAFYLQDAQGIAFSVFKMFLTPSLYPGGLFPGASKFFFVFVVPSLVVGGLPVEAVEQQSLPLVLLIWALGLVWLFLGIFIFYASVRRYESGNAIGLRG